MKKIICILFTLIIVHDSFSQDTLAGKLDEVVTTYFKYNKFNGSVLVAKGGKILLRKGYGFSNVKNQSLNDAQTIFQVGSITKEFTAAIILRLAKQRKLKLSDPLSKYFTGFPKGDSITIKNLLTQTSGIFNYTDINDIWIQSGLPTGERNVLDTIMKKPLLFSPGEKFSYSNSNYMLLAYIIQKVTHRSYESVVREQIFQPLGMSQSGFDFQDGKIKNKATGYWTLSSARVTEGPISDSSEFIGSGEIYSTVGDLYKWHVALQQGKILSGAVQKEAYRAYKGQYGYGWELDMIYGKKIVGHGGRMFGFESKMIRIPADDLFVILLNNNSDKPFLNLISRKIMAVLYHQPYTLPEQPVILPEQELKIFTGSYGADEHHIFEVRLINGHLFGIESPENMLELHPLKNERFRFMDGEGEEGVFEFGKDEKGNITGFTTVNPRGMKITLKKR